MVGLCMSEYRCLWSPEQSIRFPFAEVTDCEPLDMAWEPISGPLLEQYYCTQLLSHLSSPKIINFCPWAKWVFRYVFPLIKWHR